MTNPLMEIDGGKRSLGIGREALERLCEDYNTERALRGVAERYRINKTDEIWRLETYTPDHEPRQHMIERR